MPNVITSWRKGRISWAPFRSKPDFNQIWNPHKAETIFNQIKDNPYWITKDQGKSPRWVSGPRYHPDISPHGLVPSSLSSWVRVQDHHAFATKYRELQLFSQGMCTAACIPSIYLNCTTNWFYPELLAAALPESMRLHQNPPKHSLIYVYIGQKLIVEI